VEEGYKEVEEDQKVEDNCYVGNDHKVEK